MMGQNPTFTFEKKYLYPIWRIQDGGQKFIPSQNEVIATLQRHDVLRSRYIRNVEKIRGGTHLKLTLYIRVHQDTTISLNLNC
jgi:hypothetical protein